MNTEYCILDKWIITSDLDDLFKDDSFKVLSHIRSINNEEVSTFSRSCIVS